MSLSVFSTPVGERMNGWVLHTKQTNNNLASFSEEKELVEPSRSEPALEGWPD